MELSPELFETVTFGERWRGYDPEHVDDFLERVGVAVGQLQAKLREANERVVLVERKSRETSDADDALRRTLVLAQRTADQAVAEAEARAAEVVADAQRRAASIIGDAQQRAVAIAADAQAGLRADIEQLDDARQRLRGEVERLRDLVIGEVARWRSHLIGQIEHIDAAGGFDPAIPPVAVEIELPDPPALADVPVGHVDAMPSGNGDDGAVAGWGDAPDGDPTEAVEVLHLEELEELEEGQPASIPVEVDIDPGPDRLYEQPIDELTDEQYLDELRAVMVHDEEVSTPPPAPGGSAPDPDPEAHAIPASRLPWRR